MSNKQSGLLQLTGATQKMTFYKKKNGEYAMKRKGGISAEKFASDPRYERMRKMSQEFSSACKAASLLKRAFAPVTPEHAVRSVFQRLMSKCKEVIKSDRSHEAGYRQLIDGDADLYRNFEFTGDAKFSSVLYVQPAYTFDRVTGNVTITLPALEVAKKLKAPVTATHCRLTLGVAAVDFAEESFDLSFTESADIALDAGTIEALTLTTSIGANVTTQVFTALTIQFTQTEEDVATPTGGSKFNLMKMIAADFPA